MARRNISKTAIEGGRGRGNRWEEYFYTRSDRQASRIELRNITKYDEDPDGFVENYRYSPYYRDFRDKLAPVHRWLAAQAGRHWDDIYSDIRTQFDVRTTPGRHIVNDHIRHMVEFEAHAPRRYYTYTNNKPEFLVGLDGVLQYNGRRRWYRAQRPAVPKTPALVLTDKQAAKFFADNRCVHANRYTWYYPSSVKTTRWCRCYDKVCAHPEWKHVLRKGPLSNSLARHMGNDPGYLHHEKVYWNYRQGKDMTEKEVATWLQLDAEVRRLHTYTPDEYDKDKNG